MNLVTAEKNAIDNKDEIHVMKEKDPLLEASGKRNKRSITIILDEFRLLCLPKTWCYAGQLNLLLKIKIQ